MIGIVPAIDIIGGRCVRLTKGDYADCKVYDASPVDMAARYADCGVRRIHMVDLDGAKASSPCNLKTLESVATKVGLELEWGGGISSDEALKSVFDAGATSAVIGSVAVRRPESMRRWLKGYGPDAIILGADARGGKVAVSGWQEDSAMELEDLIASFLPDSLKEVICTDIACDGMLQGPSFDLYSKLMKRFPGTIFTASGGISCMDDVRRLSDAGVPKVIVGKAIYEGKITLKEIGQWSQNA